MIKNEFRTTIICLRNAANKDKSIPSNLGIEVLYKSVVSPSNRNLALVDLGNSSITFNTKRLTGVLENQGFRPRPVFKKSLRKSKNT